MARIVCQVLHRPNRVSFIWSEGAASFEPYHLVGQEVDYFYQAAHSARASLGRLMQGPDPQAAVVLAAAGYQLYQAIFRCNAHDPQAREIQNWLNDLRDRNQVASLDVLSDVSGKIPWNAVYDQEPADQALRSGDPAAFKHFWGFKYSLAVGKRVNPLRVACVLDSPNILLVADPDLVDKLPAGQKNLLSDWAISHELTVVDTIQGLRTKLGNQAPDVLYLFATFEGGAVCLGDETITIEQIRGLLAAAKEGNPDPIVFLQVSGDPADTGAWECFLASTVNTLSGVVMTEVPVSPALANALGVEALSRFMQNQGLGQALHGARDSQELAALAYSAFCPSHVKVAGDDNTDPDVSGPELLPLPEYPYHPLVPFESEDRGLFTGREDDIVRCAGLLDEAATRGLVLHGTGGVGKSSFLRAGLVPHLETEAVGYLALRDRRPEEQVGSESEYPVVALRPGFDLIGQLAEALGAFCAQPYVYTTPLGQTVTVDLSGIFTATLKGDPTPSHALRLLQRHPNLLADLLDALTLRLPFELVLVVEQGEDLVLQGTTDAAGSRRQDLDVLGGVLRSAARCKVVISARTEYLGRLMDQMSAGHERWRSYFLDELSEEKMLRAILLPTAQEPVPYSSEIPWQKYHFTFEHDLAPQLVQDVLRAAQGKQRSPLPLLQALCAELYDRMTKRQDNLITKADRKNLGPVEEAVGRYLGKRIKDLPLAPADRHGLRKIMEQLYLRHTDGTITRELMAAGEVAWKNPTPLETVVDAASQQGIVEVNQMLVEGRPELFISLPQEALAQAVSQWDDDRKRKAFGRTRIIDTLWIMIPLLFLAGAIIWTVTKNTFHVPDASVAELEETFARRDDLGTNSPFLKIKNEELEGLFRSKEKVTLQLEADRWPLYAGDLLRAEQALRIENLLLARQILLPYKSLKNDDLRDFEWNYLWKKSADKEPEKKDKKDATSPPPDVIAAHEGPAQALLFTPDDKALVSGGRDGKVKFWDPVTGKLLTELTGLGAVTSLAYSPKVGSALLAVGTASDKNEGEIRLWEVTWDAKEGLKTKELPALKGHTKGVTCLAFSLDGKILASGSADQTSNIWDMSTSKLKHILKGHEGEVRCLAFPREGPMVLCTGGADGKIRQWETNEGKEFRPPLQAHTGSVNAVAYFFGFVGFISAGEDKSTKFWVWNPDKQAKADPQHLANAQAVTSLAASPNRHFIATGSRDRTIKLYDTQVLDRKLGPVFGKERFTFTGLDTGILSVAVSGNNMIIAGAGENGTIHFLRAELAREPKPDSPIVPKK